MSAKLSEYDKKWLLAINSKPGQISKLDEALVTLSFDNETDEDIKILEKEIKQAKLLKRVAIMRLMVFPFEYLLGFIIFDKKYRQNKLNIIKCYYKFFIGKITLHELKKELNQYLKSGIIV